MGVKRVHDALRAPGAPKPIMGGHRGSKPLWSRDAVTAYFEKLARSGVWPDAQEVA